MKYHIVSRGLGMKPDNKGKIVGHIEADSPEQAKQNIVKSGQMLEKHLHLFDFVSAEIEGQEGR